MRVQTTQFTPDPTKVMPVNELLTRWMGTQGLVSSVYAADLKAGQPTPLIHPALLGALKSPPAPESPPERPELTSDIAQPTPLPTVMSGSVPVYQAPLQVATMAPTYEPPVTEFRHQGASVGIGMSLPQQTLQNASLLAEHTRELLRRAGANPKALEAGSELAAAASDAIKEHYPAFGTTMEGPIAVFALYNSGVGFRNAYAARDRFQMGHYLIDGSEHVVDLGAAFVDIIGHTAASTGSPTLHSVALGIRVGKLLYLFIGALAKESKKDE